MLLVIELKLEKFLAFLIVSIVVTAFLIVSIIVTFVEH